MHGYVFVEGFTALPRYEAIARLKDAVAEAEGVLVDFGFFGEAAIRLTVELEASALPRLGEALASARVQLLERCAAELATAPPSRRPVTALLHIAFLPTGPVA